MTDPTVRSRPLLVVHTGEMKGKSTAAFGMALRAWAAGLPVAVFQFVKSPRWRVGEREALLALDQTHAATGQGAPVEWHTLGQGWSWSWTPGSEDEHAAAAIEGWAEVRRRLAAQQHGCYVLDEFTYPLTWGWLEVGEVVDVLTARPGRQHVVITGRDAHPDLVAAADLVAESHKIKHPLDVGDKGQRGIEW